jgi:hypothetical protein
MLLEVAVLGCRIQNGVDSFGSLVTYEQIRESHVTISGEDARTRTAKKKSFPHNAHDVQKGVRNKHAYERVTLGI